MEYVFGVNGDIELLKTKSDHHTDFTGYCQVEQIYPDQTITDYFRIIHKFKTTEDAEGNCYDWYEIDRHYRTVDKTGPVIEYVNTLKEENKSLSDQLTQSQLALCDVYEQALNADSQLTETQLALCDVYEQLIALTSNSETTEGGTTTNG